MDISWFKLVSFAYLAMPNLRYLEKKHLNYAFRKWSVFHGQVFDLIPPRFTAEL